jgi:hypothetical protein
VMVDPPRRPRYAAVTTQTSRTTRRKRSRTASCCPVVNIWLSLSWFRIQNGQSLAALPFTVSRSHMSGTHVRHPCSAPASCDCVRHPCPALACLPTTVTWIDRDRTAHRGGRCYIFRIRWRQPRRMAGNVVPATVRGLLVAPRSTLCFGLSFGGNP